jgi:hypothetical protein
VVEQETVRLERIITDLMAVEEVQQHLVLQVLVTVYQDVLQLQLMEVDIQAEADHGLLIIILEVVQELVVTEVVEQDLVAMVFKLHVLKLLIIGMAEVEEEHLEHQDLVVQVVTEVKVEVEQEIITTLRIMVQAELAEELCQVQEHLVVELILVEEEEVTNNLVVQVADQV